MAHQGKGSSCILLAVSRDTIASVPRRLRDLVTDLIRAGFVDRGGKGIHRNILHPAGIRVTLSGRLGENAKRYQEQETEQRIAAARAALGGRT